jgi:ABC-type amino acid transport system permease subunit
LAVFASIAAIYVVIALLSGGVGGWIERRVTVLR